MNNFWLTVLLAAVLWAPIAVLLVSGRSAFTGSLDEWAGGTYDARPGPATWPPGLSLLFAGVLGLILMYINASAAADTTRAAVASVIGILVSTAVGFAISRALRS